MKNHSFPPLCFFFTMILLLALLSCQQQQPSIAIIQLTDTPSATFQTYQSFFESQDLAFSVLDSISYERLKPFDLVVVPDWKKDHTFYYALKLYSYFGGRLLGGEWKDDFWARALCSWLWGTDTERLPRHNQTTADNRAVYLSNANILDSNMVSSSLLSTLLFSELTLPEQLSYKTYDAKKPIWSLRDESLFRNNVPVVLRGSGPYRFNNNTSIERVEWFVRMAKNLGLNYLVLHSNHSIHPEHLEQCLHMLHDNQIAVMIRIQDLPNQRIGGVVSYKEKPLRDEWWLKHLVFKNHPAIFTWNMVDDTFDKHYIFIERTQRLIKRYDQTNFITTTLMDTRRPDRLPEDAFQKWSRILDFPVTYLYPLQKDLVYGAIDIKGGLEDLQILIANTQRVWQKAPYIQIWCQAHMQGPSYQKVGLGSGETFLPSSEQQRLMTYYILQAGARGIIYFNPQSLLDENLGLGRRNEIGIIWHELNPVETIIAGGKRLPLQTGMEHVEATAYSYEGETAILLSKHIPRSNRYVSGGVVQDATMIVPAHIGKEMTFYHLNYPNVQKLNAISESGGLHIQIPEFDLTTIILGTADLTREKSIRELYQQQLERMSRMALAILADKRAKTEIVLDNLPRTIRASHRETLRQGSSLHEKAAQAYKLQRYKEAYTLCRNGLKIYRAIQAQEMERAEASMVSKELSLTQKRHTNIYFSLPRYYASIQTITDVKPGQLRQQALSRIKTLTAILE